MELLVGVRHVESHFGLFGDSASVNARYVHDLHQTYHRLRNHFGCTRWNSKVMWSCGIISDRLETVIVSVQDRCVVCGKHSIGSEIVSDAPKGTPR
jgi:hypothetical protein